MFQLTQRQIDHGVFGLTASALFALFVNNLLTPNSPVAPLHGFIAVLVCVGVWAAYWRGWNAARVVLAAGLTLLIVFGAPAAGLRAFSPSAFVAPAIALVFGSPLV
jgi:hypothetical protein